LIVVVELYYLTAKKEYDAGKEVALVKKVTSLVKTCKKIKKKL